MRRLLAPLSAALLLMPWAGRAEEDGGVDPETAELGTGDLAGLLDTAVVSGPSKTDERADDSPATVTVVTSRQLRAFGLRTVHEAMNFLSLGMVAQDPLHAVEVGARGVLLSGDYGNHFLVLIDGHTMNEAWNGTAYYEQGLGLPLELVDHLELIVGPGSVLYGSSAMLGVVNVVTRRASEVGTVRATVEGSLLPAQNADGSLSLASGLGGTGRISLLSGWSTSLAAQPFELTAAFELYLHQGQTLEFGRQTGLVEGDDTSQWPQRWSASGLPGEWGGTTRRYSTQVMNAWLRARWGDFTVFVRSASYGRTTPAYDVLGNAVDFDGRAFERDRQLDVELRWSRVINPHLRLMVRGYFDLYDYLGALQSSSWLNDGASPVPDGTDLSNFTFFQELRAGAAWGGVEAQAIIDWLGDGRFPLMIGVDGRARRFHSDTLEATPDGQLLGNSNQYEATEWQLAVYAQQRARLLPSLHANIGVRVDAQSAFEPNVAPRVSLTWTLPTQGRLRLAVSSAFRTPTGYERFSQYAGSQVRNPALIPERVLGGELSFEQRLGRHRLLVVGFVSQFTDSIRLAPTGNELTSYQNIGSLLNAGGQALVEGTFGQLGYGLNFTLSSTETDEREPLPASPAWFGNARVTWTFAEDGPQASLLAHVSGPRATTAASNLGVDELGQPLSWSADARWSTAQVELRAVLVGQVKAIPGLWLRGTVGGNVMPFSAYAVGPRAAPDPGFLAPTLAPNNRLFVLFTVGWTLP